MLLLLLLLLIQPIRNDNWSKNNNRSCSIAVDHLRFLPLSIRLDYYYLHSRYRYLHYPQPTHRYRHLHLHYIDRHHHPPVQKIKKGS